MTRLQRPRHRPRTLTLRAAVGIVAAGLLLAGCAPTVGSPRWCEAMKQKARGDWTANEALDFARHCVVSNNN